MPNTKVIRVAEPVDVMAGKNVIINGGMDIFQRSGTPTTGLAITSGSASFYGLDRWSNYRNATGSTVSRQVTGDTTNLPNIQYCARIQRDSGNTSTAEIWTVQSIESANSIPLAGKTVTLSFYARKGANFSPSTFKATLYSGTGTDQNFIVTYTNNAVVVENTAISPTTTWTRYTLTGTVSASATELAFGIFFTPSGTAGAADYLEITGVQLELGSTATPFSRNGATIQGELAACQRYYWRWTATQTYSMSPFIGYSVSTSGLQFSVYPSVTMRTVPSTVDYSSGLRWTEYKTTFNAITSIAVVTGTEPGGAAGWFCGASASSGTPFTAGRVGSVTADNNSSAYIGFSAEL